MTEFIITGATGYVGYVLVNELIKRGYGPIKILIRSEKSLKRFNHLPIKYAIGSINDQEFLNQEITPNSVVFHLAGIIDIGATKNQLVYDTNVGGTVKIVNACVKNGCQKFIYSSSTSAITPNKHDKIIKEPNYLSIKNVIGHYAKSKVLSSNYVLDQCEKNGLNAVVVYPSAIIGPFDYNITNFGEIIIKYINNKFPFYTTGKYNFVDVRDVVDGLINAYLFGKSGNGYLLTGETITLKEMFIIFNKCLNKEKLPFKIPLWLIKMILPFVSLYYLITRKKPIFTRVSLKTLNLNSNFDNTKAKTNLNFNPISAEQSFKDMIEWLLQTNNSIN